MSGTIRKILLSTCTSALLVGGCLQTTGQKQTAGTLIGAAAGGLVGSQIGSGTGQLAATGAGVLLGALFGNEIGASLDRADKLFASKSAQYALENLQDGQTTSWTNPNSGNSGSVTPVNVYTSGVRTGEQYCREYQTKVTVGGKTQSAYGTVCRRPDGTWEIVG